MIDGRNIFDQAVENDRITYDYVRKIGMNTALCLFQKLL